MQSWGYFWLAAMVTFFIVEGVTYQLVSIWFAGGAVGALIASLCGADEKLQIIIFVVISAVLLIGTRPLVKKFSMSKIEKTNSDKLIGKTAVVIDSIDNLNSEGTAKVDGKLWTARSTENEKIEQGEIVNIEKIEGVKLIVKK